MKKQIIAYLLLVLLLVTVLVAGVLLAAISRQITHTVTVTGTEALSLWQEEGCETPLPQVDWGTVEPGQVHDRTIWLRNDGTATLHVTGTNSLLPSDLSMGGTIEITLAPEEVAGWDFTLYVGSMATPGSYEWATTLVAGAV